VVKVGVTPFPSNGFCGVSRLRQRTSPKNNPATGKTGNPSTNLDFQVWKTLDCTARGSMSPDAKIRTDALATNPGSTIIAAWERTASKRLATA
jgi:hypothetical protein